MKSKQITGLVVIALISIIFFIPHYSYGSSPLPPVPSNQNVQNGTITVVAINHAYLYHGHPLQLILT